MHWDIRTLILIPDSLEHWVAFLLPILVVLCLIDLAKYIWPNDLES